jgi:hypothetical protein
MNKDDKAWLLAVVYASTQPKEITPEEFLLKSTALRLIFSPAYKA